VREFRTSFSGNHHIRGTTFANESENQNRDIVNKNFLQPLKTLPKNLKSTTPPEIEQRTQRMLTTPVTGQGKGPSACPVMRSQTSKQPPVNYQTEYPALQGPAEPQTTPQTSPSTGKALTNATEAKKTKTTTSSPLLKIAKMIDQIISKHNPPGQVK